MQFSLEGITRYLSEERIAMKFSVEGMTMADQDQRTKGRISLHTSHEANPQVQITL